MCFRQDWRQIRIDQLVSSPIFEIGDSYQDGRAVLRLPTRITVSTSPPSSHIYQELL
jgi:hypothetical protein